jgi:hypothetical protein
VLLRLLLAAAAQLHQKASITVGCGRLAQGHDAERPELGAAYSTGERFVDGQERRAGLRGGAVVVVLVLVVLAQVVR